MVSHDSVTLIILLAVTAYHKSDFARALLLVPKLVFRVSIIHQNLNYPH